MIKKVIFDVDNTLIPWKDEYNKVIKEMLNKLDIQYSEDDLKSIIKAFEEYENIYLTVNKEKMLELINTYTCRKFPIEFVNGVIRGWEECVPSCLERETYEMLEKLSKKYELVILTNWFVDSQEERLKKVNILKYFTKVVGAEKIKGKPSKEAFAQAVGDNRPEECIMIGDDIKRDIKGALDAGLKAIFFNQNGKNIEIKEEGYYQVNKLINILNIL